MAEVLSQPPSAEGSTNGLVDSSNDRRSSFSSHPTSSRPTSEISLENHRLTANSQRSLQSQQSRRSQSSMRQPSLQATSEETSEEIAQVEQVEQMDAPKMKTKRPKSQYPIDSSELHVEYILVATFDIDRGSIMEHQYPGPISGDEHMLAELMLPDQAHLRNQDWTMFFLHKDTTVDDDEGNPKSKKKRRKAKKKEPNGLDTSDDGTAAITGLMDTGEDEDGEITGEEDMSESEEDDEDVIEAPPLIYVLNLVYTKQDHTVKRGAVVRAMAICTRHSFLHIYKPILLLALEDYFKTPTEATLEYLFNAVNSMDLSLMPRLSLLENIILQSSDTKDMFIEKFERIVKQRELIDNVDTDEGSDPGENVKSAVNYRHATSKYSLPRDTHEFESKVMYHDIPIPVKVPTATSSETVGDFSLIKLIQTFSAPHTANPQPFMLHPHLTTNGAFTHPIIVLVNALLTEKRVIFLGHNCPSGEVADAVLAACAIASGGILRGFTRYAFPYTDLTKIDELLKVPGFVAGVTNPQFQYQAEWWDLLCDIPSGRMKISNRIAPAPITEGLLSFQQQNPGYTGPNTPGGNNNDATNDSAFMDDILRSIANRHGEAAIRSKWRDYITKFTRIAAAFEESVYGASALYIGGEEADADAGGTGVRGHGYVWPDEGARLRELGGNVTRIEGWRNTRSYHAFKQDLAQLYTRRPIKNVDLAHHHDRLRALKLSHVDSAAIYLAFNACVRTSEQINQLLCITPETHAGLFYISLGLFHPYEEVRKATMELLDRIMVHEAGRHFWAQLGRYQKLAYMRLRREMDKKAESDRNSPNILDRGKDLRMARAVRNS
ncbi:MAG: hypothetical protein M1834_008031 [Cirrosporium novae-zelandiae]|nr:MAG: hypothetical protein M1834_008031 [Cirrosporium novae-zelandiae]